MKERLKRDKSKTHVLPISPLGLMEMTRQRAAESISGAVFEPCPYCGGRGKVKSAMTMSVELQRSLHQIMRKYQDTIHEIKVIVHPHVMQRLAHARTRNCSSKSSGDTPAASLSAPTPPIITRNSPLRTRIPGRN